MMSDEATDLVNLALLCDRIVGDYPRLYCPLREKLEGVSREVKKMYPRAYAVVFEAALKRQAY